MVIEIVPAHVVSPSVRARCTASVVAGSDALFAAFNWSSASAIARSTASALAGSGAGELQPSNISKPAARAPLSLIVGIPKSP
jgi:hypothetical protein